MKLGTIMVTAGVLALGLASLTPSKAQGPLYDRVKVNLPYSVTIGERTLQPGDYVIQQLRDNGGGSRVLLIYSDAGMKFETSAMTIPALQGTNITQEDTKVVLHHFGNDYYFDKVWIQGKDYGYEFPLPDAVKSRTNERTAPISVAATYSTTQSADSAATANTTASATTDSQSATTAATTSETATSAANNQGTTLGQSSADQSTTTTASAATTQSQTMQPATTPSTQSSAMQPSTTTDATTASNTMAQATAPATSMTGAESGSADRSMPNTSAGWLMMLLSGGALSGVGFALRRKQ